MKVNMTPNPLDVVTIHASQGDTEARQWEFELHNNGELIDTSDITEQLFFKAYKGGTEQILPENTSTPTTSPFLGDIRYPQGLLTDQEFTYRQSPTEEDGLAKITNIKGQTLKWNQLVSQTTFPSLHSENGLTITWKDSSTINISGTASEVSWVYLSPLPWVEVDNHVYLITTNNKPSGVRFGVLETNGVFSYLTDNSTYYVIKNVNGIRAINYRIVANTAFDFDAKTNMFDLTLMFGETEANRIYGLGQQGAYDYIRSFFPLNYYSYNSGSLIPFNGNGIKTVGKNLINLGVSKTETANGVTASYDSSTQKVTLSGTNTKTDSAYILIHFFPSSIPKFKIGETYVLSASSQLPPNTYFNFVYINQNGVLDGVAPTQIESQKAWRITIPSNFVTFSRLQIGIYKEARQINGEFGVQLEFGTSVTAYEPYTESVINLPISTYFPTGMKQVGNYDELTPSKATTRIGEVTLNGSENWFIDNQNVLFVCDAVANAIVTDATTQYNIYTKNNRFDDKSWATRSSVDGSLGMYYGASYIFIKSTQFADVNAIKTWLQSNPVTVYYELATPTETSFTTASLVTENGEIPLSNEDGTLVGKCTEQLSSESGFFDAKIKLADEDGECYSNKIQLHIERSPQ